MSIWTWLFGKKVKEIGVDRESMARLVAAFVAKQTPLESVPIVPFSDKQRELFECFYGTLVDRVEFTEQNKHKKKHAHDGWREGYSHPFKFDGKTHDVEKTKDLSLELYEKLMFRLTYGIEGE